MPLAWMITNWETYSPVKAFLKILVEVNHDGFRDLKLIIIDKSDAEIKGIKEAFGPRYAETPEDRQVIGNVGIQLCFFHVLQAWDRHLRKNSTRVTQEQRQKLVVLIRSMCQSNDEAAFNRIHDLFLRYVNTHGLSQVLSYYQSEWHNCRRLWSNAWMIRFSTGWKVMHTNNLVERFFRVST